MLVPKKQRVLVYSSVFKEGVMTAKKDFNCKHHELDVQNLVVIKLMQSLKSRSFVKETFNWSWHYFYLTNEGIEYLRGFLHLPEEIVPSTLKKPKAAPGAAGQRPGYGDRPPRAEGERPPRRNFGGADEKKVGPGADFKPDFRGERGDRGGFGRGGPRRDGAGPGGPPREGGAPREGGPPREGGYRREGPPTGFGRGAGRGGAPPQQ